MLSKSGLALTLALSVLPLSHVSAKVTPQSCGFSTCNDSKTRCCAMARQQLQECKAADAANTKNYSQYGQAGAQASSAIKLCIECSQLWIRQNKC